MINKAELFNYIGTEFQLMLSFPVLRLFYFSELFPEELRNGLIRLSLHRELCFPRTFCGILDTSNIMVTCPLFRQCEFRLSRRLVRLLKPTYYVNDLIVFSFCSDQLFKFYQEKMSLDDQVF